MAAVLAEPVPETLEDERIGDLLEARKGESTPWFSFEFYPPRTPDGVEKLYERLGKMAPYHPLFVDFTWGAGGSTAELTLELTIEARRRFGLLANMHLTCTNMPTEKVTEALKKAKEVGITNILALRGDPPHGQERWEPVEGGFSSALDLVAYIRKNYGTFFSVGVAGYPEGHPNRITEVPSLDGLSEAELGRVAVEREEDGTVKGYFVCKDADFEKEIAYLKEKVDAGADFVITQMFFDADVYVSFVDACRAAGINVPIIPGIMCINTVAGFKRMVSFCHTRVPGKLWTDVLALKGEDEEAVRRFGVAFGIELSQKLLLAGVSGLHFYTLNLAKVTLGIVAGLGLGPEPVGISPPPTVEKVVDEVVAKGGGKEKETHAQTLKMNMNGNGGKNSKEKEVEGELVVDEIEAAVASS